MYGHSLRGVWIEINNFDIYIKYLNVTPLGECGLKSRYHI